VGSQLDDIQEESESRPALFNPCELKKQKRKAVKMAVIISKEKKRK
jgi:hypothetical protein